MKLGSNDCLVLFRDLLCFVLCLLHLTPIRSTLTVSFFSDVLLLSSRTDPPRILYLAEEVDLPVEDNLEDYVKTARFDQECSAKARDVHASSSDESSDSSDNESITDPHEPSRIEGHLYYAGLRPKGRGPKLVYRDSSDVYEEPSGPEEYKRLMRLVAVPDDHEFGKDGLWDRVRDKVRGLLVTQQLLA